MLLEATQLLLLAVLHLSVRTSDLDHMTEKTLLQPGGEVAWIHGIEGSWLAFLAWF